MSLRTAHAAAVLLFLWSQCASSILLPSAAPFKFRPRSPPVRLPPPAPKLPSVEAPVILTINGVQYDVTRYAREHPGGAAVLRKFHGRDATKAFEAAAHSHHAVQLLREFKVETPTSIIPAEVLEAQPTSVSRWRKLFTTEDRFNVHKLLGVFVLTHFAYRFGAALESDATARFGSYSVAGLFAVGVHAVLSLSSLIFHVPRERVRGKPMIWAEFRAHNIIFALRSIVCFYLAWIAGRNRARFGSFAVFGTSAAVIASLRAADEATSRLRVDSNASTTASMPYWPDASPSTVARFKSFYAYSQYCATCGCLACINPAWPFLIMFPIQLASVLMTLVRKGILSTRGYHMLYTASLVAPFLVGFRHQSLRPIFGLLLATAAALLRARRAGISKYALWGIVCCLRVAAFECLGV